MKVVDLVDGPMLFLMYTATPAPRPLLAVVQEKPGILKALGLVSGEIQVSVRHIMSLFKMTLSTRMSAMCFARDRMFRSVILRNPSLL